MDTPPESWWLELGPEEGPTSFNGNLFFFRWTTVNFRCQYDHSDAGSDFSWGLPLHLFESARKSKSYPIFWTKRPLSFEKKPSWHSTKWDFNYLSILAYLITKLQPQILPVCVCVYSRRFFFEHKKIPTWTPVKSTFMIKYATKAIAEAVPVIAKLSRLKSLSVERNPWAEHMPKIGTRSTLVHQQELAKCDIPDC